MKYRFGDKIREIRERKKLTLREVAERAGVTESLVSQIERNKVSPATDTLLAIAEILGIDFEYLFKEYRQKKLVNLVRADERSRMVVKDTVYQQLSKTVGSDGEHGIEAYYMEINPGGSSGSTVYGHRGKELGIIVSGSGEFSTGGESWQLKKGDSISFDSSVPHMLTNTGSGMLKAYWIITPPKQFFNEM
ncbi:MAG: helix-turn-helix domain-containing protein [Spirochaetes bacterium]|jgi:transcriptional regulator with XRE-family HTH domain|nr:helix-turn-helix domain-containing protein [Spirochaetota bacterium]